MILTLAQAVQNSRDAGYACRLPDQDDPRLRDGAVFPEIVRKFGLPRGSSIFTVGSCFARSLEEQLSDYHFPAKSFSVPPNERPGRPNGILNEYNPGTMCQRIECVTRGVSFGDLCIVPEADGYIDLLLPEYVTPATKERVMERREQVDRLYRALSSAEAVILSLDLVEVWYDRQAELYLNRMPPTSCLFADRQRYEVHILDVQESQAFLERIVSALKTAGATKILLTVSPIPIEVTYSGMDCTVANSYSKAVLIVSAHHISRAHPEVSYFPSYEIVTSAGQTYYEDDKVNVRQDAVASVAGHLVGQYRE